MENDKKRQHYVWKRYLKPWVIEGKIWCKRGDTIFNTSPENVALEKFFYYAEPLNEVEYNIILAIIHRADPTAFPTLINDLNLYRAASETSEETRKNFIEDHHSMIENSACTTLDQLYIKDRLFNKDEKVKANFCYFIGLQLTRTKKAMQASITALQNVPSLKEITGKYDVQKMEKVFSLLFADFFGNWMHSKAKLFFLECPDDIEFIAGDQPVFNIHKGKDLTTPPNTVELLYPITPKLSLFITENGNSKDRELNKHECIEINKKILSESYEQIFARKEDTFKWIE